MLNFAVVVLTVIVMEGVAWATHRYVMHGWGWGWHRSHHEPHDGTFEKNDLYAVVIGAVSVAFMAFGSPSAGILYWIGIGMAVYGLFYFILHDGLVHQRWPFRYIPHSGYLKRLVQAHRLHHAVKGREGCVSFGFLYAPPVARIRDELRSKGSLEKIEAEPQ